MKGSQDTPKNTPNCIPAPHFLPWIGQKLLDFNTPKFALRDLHFLLDG